MAVPVEGQGPVGAIGRFDLADIGEHLGGNDYGNAYLDPLTGDIFPVLSGEVLGPDGEVTDPDEHEWVAINGQGSREAYVDMESFAENVANVRLRDQLEIALDGRGAFRRFRDVMYHRAPEEVGRAWNAYREARSSARAVDWLVDCGLVNREEAQTTLDQLDERAEAALADARGASRKRD